MQLFNVYCVLGAHRKCILLDYNTLYTLIKYTSDVSKLCTLFMYIDMVTKQCINKLYIEVRLNKCILVMRIEKTTLIIYIYYVH